MTQHRNVSLGLVLAAFSLLIAQCQLFAEYPKPSPYPKAWEFKFEPGLPKRVVIQTPGSAIPQAYWYMTYTVTNNTDREGMFLPNFDLLTSDGRLLRSDLNIPLRVFEAIKAHEKKQFLEPYPKIAGEILLGEDQARDGVAIWPEPAQEMGEFSIFVGGLSGEVLMLKDDKGEPVKNAQGNPVILRKTLQLNFLVRGDELFPGADRVNAVSKEWVMR